ncbi:polysaccharide biosynthesis protein [Alphaproteobacteria bacterium]|nr:polysaccharide biosynthesis protein [Alphaproteobacteria bacterium]
MTSMIKNFNKNIIIKALKIPRAVKRALAVSLDSFLSIFATWMALSFYLNELVVFNWQYLIHALLSVSILIPILLVFGFYKFIFRYATGDTLSILAKSISVYALIYSLFFLLTDIKISPKSIILMQPMILFILISFSRWLVKIWLNQLFIKDFNKKSKKGVIIYGTGKAGRQLALSLIHSNQFKFLFFVDDNKNLWGGSIEGHAVKPPSYIKKFINPKKVRELWFAMPKLSILERRKLIKNFHGLPLHVRTLPNFSYSMDGNVHVKDLRELDINELLDRDNVKPTNALLKKCVYKKNVLVTGAGGSIGSEICRQILNNNAKCILLLENSEIALYNIHSELEALINKQSNNSDNKTILIPLLASVQDENKLNHIFETWKPFTVYHAAAYKHVPMVEHNVVSGILNNLIGTLKCAKLAIKYNVSHFVLVSTDKAVRPTNIMGASKRLSEISLQLMNSELKNKNTRMCIVRFGNVLGSSGSVAPLFEKQIEAGGPITLTHQDVTRYFMTVTEAAQLVIQAGAMSKGGEVFLLDMGQPIRIIDLARRMIQAKGLQVKDTVNPWGDIEIQVNGLRHGEKLYEELLIGENSETTMHPRILQADEKFMNKRDFQTLMEKLTIFLEQNNTKEIIKLLKNNIPGYTPMEKDVDLISQFQKK